MLRIRIPILAPFILPGLVLLACSQVKRLAPADRLGSEEKLHYLILASLDQDAAQDYQVQPSADTRTGYLEWFWGSSEFIAEKDLYWQRAVQARDFFGSIDLLGDDRVRTYIRYGPARRESYEPEPVRTETLTVIVNPAEIWTYDELGLQFDFVKKGTAYKLVGESRFGPAYTAPSFEQVDLVRPAPQLQEEVLSFDLEFALGRFEQVSDTVETELHYGIPQNQLAGLVQENRLPELFFRMEFVPAGREHTIGRDLWVLPAVLPKPADPRLAVGREVFRLPADVYTVTVKAWSADGSVTAQKTGKLNLLDYVRRAQPSSDMMFYSLADSTFQSPQFVKTPWLRLVPMVQPLVRTGHTFYALYELYNLGLDEQGRHRVEADYEIIERTTNQLAVVPTPTRFVTGSGLKAVVVERVHTMDLRPGPYLLVARVRDLEKNRDISLTARFRITAP